jgi:hypothetical protein
VAGGRRDRHAGKSSEKANAATAAMRAARPWRDTAIDNTRRLKLNLGAEIREKRENWEIREENNREIRGDRGGDREIGEVREKNNREIREVREKNNREIGEVREKNDREIGEVGEKNFISFDPP